MAVGSQAVFLSGQILLRQENVVLLSCSGLHFSGHRLDSVLVEVCRCVGLQGLVVSPTMPQLRSGKVVGAETLLVLRGAEVECELGKQVVVELSPQLAPEREPEQPSPSHSQPAALSGGSSELTFLLSVQKEQAKSRQRPGGKKNKGIQSRVSSERKNGSALQVSDSAVCEGGQAAIVAGVCLEKTVGKETGQGQQSFCLGTDLQKTLSGKTGSPERPNLSGFQENMKPSGKKRKHSYMELKLQIPALDEGLERTEGHSVVSCLSEPEVLQPRKGVCSTEMKGAASLMILNLQIPGLKSLETEESFLSEPEPQEVVGNPESMNGCSLERLKKTKKEGKRYLTKKRRQSLVKSELQEPRSALLDLYTQCVESKENSVSLTEEDSLPLLCVQDLSGQEQSAAGGEQRKCCIVEHQLSSDLQKGADSLQESGKHLCPIVEVQV